MAKGIGNGTPLAAVVKTPDIAQSLIQRIHFNTFGGNPVACAMGKAAPEVIERENLQHNDLEVEAYLTEGLAKRMNRHDVIGEVRRKGLIVGVKLVNDTETKEAAGEEWVQMFERAKELGLLIGKGGFYGNVLRPKPPICITRVDVDFMLEVLDIAFAESQTPIFAQKQWVFPKIQEIAEYKKLTKK